MGLPWRFLLLLFFLEDFPAQSLFEIEVTELLLYILLPHLRVNPTPPSSHPATRDKSPSHHAALADEKKSSSAQKQIFEDSVRRKSSTCLFLLFFEYMSCVHESKMRGKGLFHIEVAA